MLVNEWSEQQQAAPAVGVEAVEGEARLLAGIKARILQPERPPALQPPQWGVPSVVRRILPLERAAASGLFKQLERRAFPIQVIFGHEGSGKTSAARAFARDPANSHVIYVDLHACSSYEEATKRVASAVGYRMTYTDEEERARKGRFGIIHNLDKPWDGGNYNHVLRLFMRASGELLAAGKLKGNRPPMLLLDHVSHPFRDTKRTAVSLDDPPPGVMGPGFSPRMSNTLIYQTLESTNTSDLAENRQCCIVLIVGNAADRDSWEQSSARDSLSFSMLPAFTTEEATELLAHHQYFKLFPTARSDQHPPADEVAKIKRAYASTFAFLIAALGTRARVLALCIDSMNGEPLVPDAELATKGVPIPPAMLARLPATLPATVAAALASSTSPASASEGARA